MKLQSDSPLAGFTKAYQPQSSPRPGTVDRRALSSARNEFCDPQCPARNVYAATNYSATPASSDFFRMPAPTMPRVSHPAFVADSGLEDWVRLIAEVPSRPALPEDAVTSRRRLHMLLAQHPWLDDASWPFAGLLRAFADAYIATHPGASTSPFDYAAAIEHVRSSAASCNSCTSFKKRFARLRDASSCQSNQLPAWLK